MAQPARWAERRTPLKGSRGASQGENGRSTHRNARSERAGMGLAWSRDPGEVTQGGARGAWRWVRSLGQTRPEAWTAPGSWRFTPGP